MTYSDKVKASNIIKTAILALEDKQSIRVSYGTDYNKEPMVYRITCDIYRDGKPSYSIYRDDVWGLNGMNISEISNTMAKAYTFDMMNQRTAYNFPLYEMELVN